MSTLSALLSALAFGSSSAALGAILIGRHRPPAAPPLPPRPPRPPGSERHPSGRTFGVVLPQQPGHHTDWPHQRRVHPGGCV